MNSSMRETTHFPDVVLINLDVRSHILDGFFDKSLPGVRLEGPHLVHR